MSGLLDAERKQVHQLSVQSTITTENSLKPYFTGRDILTTSWFLYDCGMTESVERDIIH